MPSVSGPRPLTLGSNAEGEISGALLVLNRSLYIRRSNHSSSVIGSASRFIVTMSGHFLARLKHLSTTASKRRELNLIGAVSN